MSNRIRKLNKKSSETATVRKSSLLKAFSTSHSIAIPSYNNYVVYEIQSYRTSPQDTSRYEKCVLRNRSGYDILNVSDKQLFHFASQHTRLESEVQEATEKLLRL